MASTYKYINKEDLINGEYYICDGRNFDVGLWNGEYFLYIRHKFGGQLLDKEYHWDDGAPHGTVKPIQRILSKGTVWNYKRR